jgi:hypothetical protein
MRTGQPKIFYRHSWRLRCNGINTAFYRNALWGCENGQFNSHSLASERTTPLFGQQSLFYFLWRVGQLLPKRSKSSHSLVSIVRTDSFSTLCLKNT